MIFRPLAAALALAFATQPANARVERWSAYANGAESTITDCIDCEEDIGILISCKGSGQAAELLVMFLSSDQDPTGTPGADRIVFLVDGSPFEYTASQQYFGLIGYTPKISLRRNDPMVEALQAGQQLFVQYAGGSINFPLTGSRDAFTAFSRACPWGDTVLQANAPQTGQPQIGRPQVGQPQIGQPQIGRPQVGQPQIGQPQIGRPQVGQPQIGQPQIGRTQVGQPQIGQPQIGRPQVGQPQIGQPQIGRPQVGQPQIGQPQIGQPQIGRPQVGQPQIGQPQIGRPQVGQPQIGQPQIGRPQVGQPQIGQPQIGQPQLGRDPTGGAQPVNPFQPPISNQQPQNNGFSQTVRFPFDTRSGGGRVRAAPNLQARQVGSTREMDPITLIEEVPGSYMDGYPWFLIRYSGGQGYQWGGIVCRPRGSALQGTYGECTR